MYSDDVALFLTFLDQSDSYTFGLLDEESKGVIPGYGVIRGGVGALTKALDFLGGQGVSATAHVTLCTTDGRGRRAANIREPRVLCADIDRVVGREEVKGWVKDYSPHLIVESSPGKFHLYWKVSGLGLEEWKTWQLVVAQAFGGDLSLAQVTKTIRVPGVRRRTKDGSEFMPAVVWAHEDVAGGDGGAVTPYGIDTLRKIWPAWEELLGQAQARIKEGRRAIVRLSRGLGESSGFAAGSGKSQKTQANLGAHGRNELLYATLRRRVANLALDPIRAEGDLYELGTSCNEQLLSVGFNSILPDEEVRKVVASAWLRGSEARTRKEEKLKAALGEVGAGAAGVVEALPQPLSDEIVAAMHEAANGANGHGSVINGNGHHSDDTSAVELPEELKFSYNYTAKDSPSLEINRFTDEGLLDRFLQRYGERVLRVGNAFYTFVGELEGRQEEKIWEVQTPRLHPHINEYIGNVMRDVVREPEFIRELGSTDEGTPSITKLRRAQERFQSSNMKTRLCGQVLNCSKIRKASPDIFDAIEHLIYVQNGVLDMRTGKVRGAQARDYMLRRSGVTFDPGATCPGWETFVLEVFDENDDPAGMVSMLQEIFGYSLSASISEQKIFCHYGTGSNGKSKVLQALWMLGGEYASIIDPDELGKRKGSFTGARFERFGAKVEGCRVAVIDDLDVQTVWNEAFVKNLTSPHMRARAEYELSRVVANRAKIHVGLNERPAPESESYGLLRRLMIIPYERQFDPTSEGSNRIDRMIEEEASGILNWALAGYRHYKERGGLPVVAEMQEAVQEYRKEFFTSETKLDDLFENAGNPPDMSPSDYRSTTTDEQKTRQGSWYFTNELADIARENGLDVTEDRIGKMIRKVSNRKPTRIWNQEEKNSRRAHWILVRKLAPHLL